MKHFRVWITVMLALALSLPLLPARTLASGSWLDSPATSWQQAGMPIPLAPVVDEALKGGAPANARAVESPEDEALVAAGWSLYNPVQSGWGVSVVEAATAYGLDTSPMQRQAFVFVDGGYVGTLAPAPTDPNSDGALDRVALAGPATILAQFHRYDEPGSLAGPDAITTATYQIQRGASPALALVSTDTQLTSAAPGAATVGPSVLMEIDADEIQAGQTFTISIEARADQGVDRITWYAGETDDVVLQQVREVDCGGAGLCRYSWPVSTSDTTGQIMIHASARDTAGRESDALVQELRVREASSPPELTLNISEEKVTVGQQFTVELEASSADGIDKLVWRGAGTNDAALQQPREYDCGGANVCRSSWPVSTTDTTGQVTILATAHDLNGQQTEDVTQALKVGKTSSKPTVELRVSRARVSAGEQFKIEVYARSGEALDKIWWYATDTSDAELKRDHTSQCDGSETCRATWQVATTDKSGTITIVAKARDKNGRESEKVTQKLRIVR
ncbi:MAG: LppP/LprE family lipoprotein [Chloroflexi bacterium]|nr:LppP/LprE family lipoprotein [Chloroflexota bacterium]